MPLKGYPTASWVDPKARKSKARAKRKTGQATRMRPRLDAAYPETKTGRLSMEKLEKAREWAKAVARIRHALKLDLTPEERFALMEWRSILAARRRKAARGFVRED